MTDIHPGGCLCGAVRYELRGPLRDVLACYCGQCQKTTGNFVAATAVSRDRLQMLNEVGLSWYASSPGIRRGFCQNCGGNLFWEMEGEGNISVMAGTLDDSSHLKTVGHIFVEYKAAFHHIPSGAPSHPKSSRGTDDYPVMPEAEA